MMWAAAVWGLAEATLFFIVPDVLLSLIAVRDRRLALRACGTALAGALAGGVLMYAWGARDAAGVQAWLDAVPAVSTGLIDDVARALGAEGFVAMLLGPLSGTPYKLYAAQSGALGLSFALFVLVSIPARLVRFLAISLFAAWVAARLPAAWPVRWRQGIALVVWAVFYTVYFIRMPS